MIHDIPVFAEPTYQSLTKLILRNNNLTTLEGKLSYVLYTCTYYCTSNRHGSEKLLLIFLSNKMFFF